MNKNIFFYVAVPIIYLLLFTLLVISANAQTRRTLWHGNAAVEGDFDAVGGSISGEAVSATGDITAANDMIIGASEVAIDIDGLEPTQDNYVLMLDYLNNKISLEAVTASSLASLDNIEDVTVTTPVDGELLGYNGAYWENLALALEDISNVSIAVTPGMGSVFTWDADIDKAEFKSHISIPIYSTTIGSATSSLFGDGSNITNLPSGGVAALEDIGDVTITSVTDGQVLEYDAALPGWINATSSGGASTLSDLTDVNISGPVLNEVLSYDGSQWINQVMSGGGGGGGSAELIFDYIIAATDSINAASADIVCDGTADNESIQYAVDLVSSNNGGSILLLAGNYRFDAAVSITSGSDHISIYGQRGGIYYTGDKSTVLDRRYDSSSANTGVININAANGISLYDITVHGNDGYFSSDNNSGISIQGSTFYAHLERVWVHDSGGCGFYVYGYEPSLYHCRASGCSHAGFMLGNFLSGNQGYFLNCTSINNTGSGYTWNGATNPSEVQFIGCRAEDNGGWGFSGFDDSIITNCKITNNTSGGMYLSDNNIVTGNDIYGGVNGIWMDGSNNFISANSIISNTDNGIRGDTLGYYNSIHDNRITSSGKYGIFLYNCDYTSIQNNYFASITGTGHGGISLNASADNTQILNNMFYNNNLGVELNPGASGDPLNTIIKGNSFLASTSMDIYIHNANTVIIENNIFNSAGTATRLIYITTTPTPGILFSNNIVKGTYPLFIDGGGVMEQIYNTSSPAYGARADVFIMSASASTKIGFATDDPTTITNVITVGSGATTDPIANNWATWSNPELKENIEPVDAAIQEAINKDFDGYDLISYDWKYPYPAPAASDFKDKVDETAEAQYTKELEAYKAKKSAWYAKRNRYKSWALDLKSIPDDVAAYTDEGRKIGYNVNQIVMRLIAVLKRTKEQVNQLEQRVAALEAARE